jgi:hypothetical protein
MYAIQNPYILLRDPTRTCSTKPICNHCSTSSISSCVASSLSRAGPHERTRHPEAFNFRLPLSGACALDEPRSGEDSFYLEARSSMAT